MDFLSLVTHYMTPETPNKAELSPPEKKCINCTTNGDIYVVRLRQVMYERLVLLSGGGLSRAMEDLLAFDPIAPVLAPSHLLALDRRLLHILAALSACEEQLGGWHHVLF